MDTAAQTIPGIQQQIEQTENQIRLLLGENPGDSARADGASPSRSCLPKCRPVCLRQLLERRPDIRAAEQDLIAANAQIGVARAAYFPAVESERSALGGQSTQLSSLFSGPAQHVEPGAAGYAADLHGGAAEIRRQAGARPSASSALVQYEKTIQTAFTEVSNSLIAHQRVRESREQQEALVIALQDRLRLAYIRYRGGVDTQLNALDADRDLFQAELTLAQIRLDELLTVVQLYKALGGGWQ